MSTVAFGQGNCLIYPEHSGERLACELSYRAITYKQGSKASQLLFDAAIRLGPNYAYAYYEKSVPFFKRGMLNEGVNLLNKAIALEPENYLCYRAYWYFSHRSYQACIDDLETYYNKLNATLGSTPGGDMEMHMLLGMSYAATNQVQKGIDVVTKAIASYEALNYFIGPFDYHVLGLLYFENNELKKAQSAFDLQLQMNEHFADTYFYLGKIAKIESNDSKASELLKMALEKLNGVDGGFSFSGFADYNVSKEMVEELIKQDN